MLDQAGFTGTTIVLSNNLDELTIWQIISQISEEAWRYDVDADQLIGRLAYGVGTHLITSEGDPALGGVYKLVAVRDKGDWIPAIKISESAHKTPNPDHKHVWRLYDQRGIATADLLSLDSEDPRQMEEITLRHPSNQNQQRQLRRADLAEIEPLLVEILRQGELVYQFPTIEEIRARRQHDLDRLDPGVKRIMNPHIYHVSLTQSLWELKKELIRSVREQGSAGN
jgi:nicotinate phosphoribosyltransferase